MLIFSKKCFGFFANFNRLEISIEILSLKLLLLSITYKFCMSFIDNDNEI